MYRLTVWLNKCENIEEVAIMNIQLHIFSTVYCNCKHQLQYCQLRSMCQALEPGFKQHAQYWLCWTIVQRAADYSLKIEITKGSTRVVLSIFASQYFGCLALPTCISRVSNFQFQNSLLSPHKWQWARYNLNVTNDEQGTEATAAQTQQKSAMLQCCVPWCCRQWV